MTGYMFVLGRCYGCGVMFSFNADWVPSLRVNGEKEPICEGCVRHANPKRVANGLAPIVIHPEAYQPGQVN